MKKARFPYHELSNYRIALQKLSEERIKGKQTKALDTADKQVDKNALKLAHYINVWERDVEIKP